MNKFNFLIFVFFVLFSCSKDKDTVKPQNPIPTNPVNPSNPPLPETLNVNVVLKMTSIGKNQAKYWIEFNSGAHIVTNFGVCWDTLPMPKINLTTKTNHVYDYNSMVPIQYKGISGLIEDKTYYLRGYVSNGTEMSYSNQVIFTTNTLEIGEDFEGGKIAYILQPSDPGYIAGETHGLITSEFDIASNVLWDTSTTYSNYSSSLTNLLLNGDCFYPSWDSVLFNAAYCSNTMHTDYGRGAYYTNEIVMANGYSDVYAAKICVDYSSNGYADWHLPSGDEMFKLYVNSDLIGYFDFNASGYWISRRDIGDFGTVAGYALSINYGGYIQLVSEKWPGYLRRVRPVRYF